MRLFLKQITVILVVGGILTGPAYAQGPGSVIATGASEFLPASAPAAVGGTAPAAIAGGGTYAEMVGDIPWADELTGETSIPVKEGGNAGGPGIVSKVVGYVAQNWMYFALGALALGALAYFLTRDKGGKKKDTKAGSPCNKTPTQVLPVDPSCENIKCQNGGTCKNGVCECPSGYTGNRCETQSGLGSIVPDTTIRNPSGLSDGGLSANDPLTAGAKSGGGGGDGGGAAADEARRGKVRENAARNYTLAKENLKRGDKYKETADAVNSDIQSSQSWRDSFGAVVEADMAAYDESARFLTVLTDQANQITTDVVGGGSLVQIQEENVSGAADEQQKDGE